MDHQRRNTIKMLLAGVGVTITEQTLINIAQAASIDAVPAASLFTKQQYQVIGQLADVILPKSQTPNATALKLPNFVEQMFKFTLADRQQESFLRGLTVVMADISANELSNQSTSTNHFQGLVTRYFSLTASMQSEKQALILLEHKDVPAQQKPDYYRYYFLLTLRAFLIIGFISHEQIAKQLQDPRDFPQPYQPGQC